MKWFTPGADLLDYWLSVSGGKMRVPCGHRNGLVTSGLLDLLHGCANHPQPWTEGMGVAVPHVAGYPLPLHARVEPRAGVVGAIPLPREQSASLTAHQGAWEINRVHGYLIQIDRAVISVFRFPQLDCPPIQVDLRPIHGVLLGQPHARVNVYLKLGKVLGEEFRDSPAQTRILILPAQERYASIALSGGGKLSGRCSGNQSCIYMARVSSYYLENFNSGNESQCVFAIVFAPLLPFLPPPLFSVMQTPSIWRSCCWAGNAFVDTHAADVQSGIATFSGGALFNNSTFSLDKTGVYGTAEAPQGLGYTDPIKISFSQGVSNVSLELVDHGTASFSLTDNLGQTITENLSSSQDLTFNFTGDGITSIYINEASPYWDFAIDNVSFTSDAPTVPEPSTFALMGTGIPDMAGAVRRKFVRL
jgi:hypothetical protein